MEEKDISQPQVEERENEKSEVIKIFEKAGSILELAATSPSLNVVKTLDSVNDTRTNSSDSLEYIASKRQKPRLWFRGLMVNGVPCWGGINFYEQSDSKYAFSPSIHKPEDKSIKRLILTVHPEDIDAEDRPGSEFGSYHIFSDGQIEKHNEIRKKDLKPGMSVVKSTDPLERALAATFSKGFIVVGEIGETPERVALLNEALDGLKLVLSAKQTPPTKLS